MLLTLATTGMRKGELAALTWKDIDFESKIIAITKTRDEYGIPKLVIAFALSI
ncbi:MULTISPECIES: tyrosine-type recombinase/integrase [Lysinibacillus]|uniref:tyrosine-type recombinase/integrase n=1 Tax=Lysinibacillus TaxID=400634 RepID=UPI00240EB2A8|nr:MULTISPECIES: tyrosine-type recombinase/integrase [Lysinibacillus]